MRYPYKSIKKTGNTNEKTFDQDIQMANIHINKCWKPLIEAESKLKPQCTIITNSPVYRKSKENIRDWIIPIVGKYAESLEFSPTLVVSVY